MRLAVLKERRAGETRVAATPETVRKLVQLGLTVAVEAGAGAGASVSDAVFTEAGAEIAHDAASALAGAGVVFAVQLPEQSELAAIPRGALLVCTSGLMANKSAAEGIAAAGIDLAAMELLPRITRAQSMDVLSSQANLAGYRAVIEGAFAFDRGFPMMMTAAGTVPPARVFVMGAGVAGLQAIATARRLGAIVSATDVRPAAKEEIKSLGATFVGVEDTETATQTGAYAKEMSAEFKQKQAELITATVAKNDLIICTALVQGGRAPTLVTEAMVAGMKPGSVIVDLASDGGGNCALTRPGEAFVTDGGVKILGYRNWPGRIGVAASALYAKNLLTFLTTFWDKDAKAPKLPAEDAIIQGVLVTRGGVVVHANFAPAAPPVPAPSASETAPGVAAAGPAAPEPAAAAPVEPAAAAPDVEQAPIESISVAPEPEPVPHEVAAEPAGHEAAAPPPAPEEELPAPDVVPPSATSILAEPHREPAETHEAEPPHAPAVETEPAMAQGHEPETPVEHGADSAAETTAAPAVEPSASAGAPSPDVTDTEPHAAAALEPAAPAAPSSAAGLAAAAKKAGKKPDGPPGQKGPKQGGGKGGKQGGTPGRGPSGERA